LARNCLASATSTVFSLSSSVFPKAWPQNSTPGRYISFFVCLYFQLQMLSFTVKSKWEHLSEHICNPSKNFRNLRNLFHSRANPKISSPCISFFPSFVY
jgi:hypothetical protein